jgi:hypothetical protein
MLESVRVAPGAAKFGCAVQNGYEYVPGGLLATVAFPVEQLRMNDSDISMMSTANNLFMATPLNVVQFDIEPHYNEPRMALQTAFKKVLYLVLVPDVFLAPLDPFVIIVKQFCCLFF